VAASRLIALAACVIALGCDAGSPPDANGDAGPAEDTAAIPDRAGIDGSAGPIELMDVEGRRVRLAAAAQRVVSLVPSVTETVIALGASNRLAARTDYDSQPELGGLPSVGGGLGPDLEALAAAEPDLVVRFGGDSDPATVRWLDDLGIPHVAVRPDRLDDVWTIVEQMGVLLGIPDRASRLAGRLRAGIDSVRTAVADRPPVRVGYLMGGSPPWSAGSGTYVDELITLAGGVNVFDDIDGRFGAVSPEVVATRAIDVVLLSEGADIDARLLEGRRVEALSGVVEIPGPRIVEAAREVAAALHPDLVLDPDAGLR
jgi:iron complex transport system substrate-binding protein